MLLPPLIPCKDLNGSLLLLLPVGQGISTFVPLLLKIPACVGITKARQLFLQSNGQTSSHVLLPPELSFILCPPCFNCPTPKGATPTHCCHNHLHFPFIQQHCIHTKIYLAKFHLPYSEISPLWPLAVKKTVPTT